MSDLIYGLLVAGGLAIWAYLRGRDAGKAKAEQHAAEASTKRQKDIEDALDTVDGSPDGWRELLKARK